MTNNIGEEDNFWVKGKFTETNNHEKLNEKLPFELNIYSELKDFNSDKIQVEKQSELKS